MTKLVKESKLKYEGVRGIAHIREPGNAVRRHTGSWRVMKPVIDHSKCIGCKTCFLSCPDSAYKWENKKPNPKAAQKGSPKIDYTMCKGCGICAAECPVKCIKMIRDEHKEAKHE
jgi:2-oxoacid:acceptor oxidoreductase delta subunit (pyruvate/2-ketoisovalerate family)